MESNSAALRHGAWSPRKVDPLAEELVQMALVGAAYLGDPSYAAALYAWARAEARVQLLAEYLDEHGPLDEHGSPRPALDALVRCERLAGEQRVRLGLDPLSVLALVAT